MLEVKDLWVNRKGIAIVKGVNLSIKKGEKHVLMGPNGSGKSTLALSIMGSPRYEVKGKIKFNGKDITNLNPEERAKMGMFLAFQHPPSLIGLRVNSFLRELREKFNGDDRMLKEFEGREVNVGFSGGEKKRFEIGQMLVMKPKLAILDELDAGLDVDALREIRDLIKKTNCAFLIITHTGEIVKGMKGIKVHVMINGRIVAEGGEELLTEVIEGGYKRWM